MEDIKLYTLPEVGRQVRLTRGALHYLIRRGRLAVIQPGGPGGRRFVRQEELDRLLRTVNLTEGKK